MGELFTSLNICDINKAIARLKCHHEYNWKDSVNRKFKNSIEPKNNLNGTYTGLTDLIWSSLGVEFSNLMLKLANFVILSKIKRFVNYVILVLKMSFISHLFVLFTII